jgi:hypothetical protein
MTTTKNHAKLHKPAQFIPSDYAVVGMFYNRMPKASPFAGWSSPDSVRYHMEAVAEWKAEKKALFCDHDIHPYACQHCGQTNVAYVASVEHLPTGERICMGWQCCERIDLSLDAYKMRAIKSKATAQLKLEKLRSEQAAYLGANPEVAEVIKAVEAGEHKRNSFIRDVVGKFWQWGSLSEKQGAAIVKSSIKDREFAAEKAKEDNKPKAAFPSSEKRVTIVGRIASVKLQESFYGCTWKMLVIAEDGNKFWGSIPSSLDEAGKGDLVQFDAKCEVSNDDAHFGFFSRPTKAMVIESVAVAA